MKRLHDTLLGILAGVVALAAIAVVEVVRLSLTSGLLVGPGGAFLIASPWEAWPSGLLALGAGLGIAAYLARTRSAPGLLAATATIAAGVLGIAALGTSRPPEAPDLFTWTATALATAVSPYLLLAAFAAAALLAVRRSRPDEPGDAISEAPARDPGRASAPARRG